MRGRAVDVDDLGARARYCDAVVVLGWRTSWLRSWPAPAADTDTCPLWPARSPKSGQRVCGVSRRGYLGGSWFGWVCELGLTRMHGLASASVECLAIDLSARPAHPPDTHRSGGVTY
jgi:hypothetical protein